MIFRRPLIRTLTLVAGFAVFAGATAVRGDLAEEPTITEGLIGVAIAYEIGERCDDIRARRFAGINYLLALKREALGLGYSDAEIDAFIDNDAAQESLEAEARQRLRNLGAVSGDWDTYCTVGRSEMAAGTIAGQLLR